MPRFKVELDDGTEHRIYTTDAKRAAQQVRSFRLDMAGTPKVVKVTREESSRKVGDDAAHGAGGEP